LMSVTLPVMRLRAPTFISFALLKKVSPDLRAGNQHSEVTTVRLESRGSFNCYRGVEIRPVVWISTSTALLTWSMKVLGSFRPHFTNGIENFAVA